MEPTLTPSAVPLVRKLPLSGDRTVALGVEFGRGEMTRVLTGAVSGEVGGHRKVAVKLFDRLPHVKRDKVMDRLARALNAATCLCDPRVVQIYDYDLARLEPFVVMELVEGGTLEMLLDGFERQGLRMPQDVAVLVAIKIAEALEAALACKLPDGSPAPLVHGHLTARDVLVSWSGEVKVGDFGINASTMLASGPNRAIDVERLAPLAPEVAAGDHPDERSDVFGLGVLVRRMLLGPRFLPGTPLEDAMQKVRAGVIQTSIVENGVLAPLRAILKRATSPDPRRRYAHAGEMAADLRAIAALMGIPDVPAFVARAVDVAFAPEIASGVASDEIDTPRVRRELPARADADDLDSAPTIARRDSGVELRASDSAPTVVCAAQWLGE